jgi:2-pyrone-4,6-dicarboxylate lactonase
VTSGYLPHRAETTAPSFAVPPGTCDCHAPIFGPASHFLFPESASYAPPDPSQAIVAAGARFISAGTNAGFLPVGARSRAKELQTRAVKAATPEQTR